MAHTCTSAGKRGLWLTVFFLSGAASLGYQTVWTKMFANGLGHEVPAMLSVVCAFMTGMALGAWLTARRPLSRNVATYYAALELIIGFSGLASFWAIPASSEATLRWLGANPATGWHWTVAFATTLIITLPGTAAMGATFALMERLLAEQSAGGRAIGVLYASNTLGAVLGIIVGTFVLMPQLGLRTSLICLAALNFLCSLFALQIRRTLPFQDVSNPTGTSISSPRLRSTLLATGLLGIGLEVAGIRLLSQVLENTVFTFAIVLAVYLLGTSAGAAVYQRFERRMSVWWLLWSASMACLASAMVLGKVQLIHEHLQASFSDSFAASLAVELLCGATVFVLPSVVFGALFSYLFQAAKDAGMNLGRAYALNCLGSALAPLVVAVFLFPAIGAKRTLLILALAYLALLPAGRGIRWVFLGLPLLMVFMLPKEIRIVSAPTAGSLVEFREGRMASVAVIQDGLGDRTLRVNNRFQMGGTSAHQAEYRQAHLPLLLHSHPRRALFLGVGTGITMSAAELYPGLEVEGVELVPEVVEVMPHFAPYNRLSETAPRVFVADARRYVRATSKMYDVIVADLFHPARDGAGTLYTREHFSSIRRQLNQGGLFCQWLPLHQIDENMLRLVIRTFLAVFPNAQAYLLHFNIDVPVLGLLGYVDQSPALPVALQTRTLPPELEAQLKKLSLADSLRLFGHFVGGRDFLAAYAGDGAVNTDDRQRLTFGAPAFSFRRNVSPDGRLWPLLQPGETAAAQLNLHEDASRLARFIDARNIYLHGLAAEAGGAESTAVDHFIESARLSEDFTAGYAQCLSKASLWIQKQPTKARDLLRRLAEAQPSRTIAQDMLDRLNRPGN